jgi:hypothetical protein
MSTIRNIHLVFPGPNDESTRQDANPIIPTGECQINIKTDDTWTITGEYQDNRLRAITLNRKSNQDTE